MAGTARPVSRRAPDPTPAPYASSARQATRPEPRQRGRRATWPIAAYARRPPGPSVRSGRSPSHPRPHRRSSRGDATPSTRSTAVSCHPRPGRRPTCRRRRCSSARPATRQSSRPPGPRTSRSAPPAQRSSPARRSPRPLRRGSGHGRMPYGRSRRRPAAACGSPGLPRIAALPGLGQQTTAVLRTAHPVQPPSERGDQADEVLQQFIPAAQRPRV